MLTKGQGSVQSVDLKAIRQKNNVNITCTSINAQVGVRIGSNAGLVPCSYQGCVRIACSSLTITSLLQVVNSLAAS